MQALLFGKFRLNTHRVFGERHGLVIHCLHFSNKLCNLMKYDIP